MTDIVTPAPTVSVIIPTFNRSTFLRAAVASVFAQTYSEFEAIVVDDGSTDNTREVIEAIDDSRVRYFWQPNGGRSSARNRGLEEAHGQLIAYLDDDDLYFPDKLQAQVEALATLPDVGLVGAGAVYVDADGNGLGDWYPWLSVPKGELLEALLHCPLTPSMVLVRRRWLEESGGFDEALDLAEDTDLFLRMILAGCRVAWVPRTLWAYRVHPSNSQGDGTRYMNARLRILGKVFCDPRIPSEVLSARERVYAYSYLVGALHEYASGQIGSASRDMQLALALDPSILDDNAKQLFEAIVGRAIDYNVAEPEEYVTLVFDNLPPEVSVVQNRRASAVEIAAKAKFFRAHQAGQRRAVLASCGRALRQDPLWITNRGVLSVLGQTVFGERFVQVGRRLARQRSSCARESVQRISS